MTRTEAGWKLVRVVSAAEFAANAARYRATTKADKRERRIARAAGGRVAIYERRRRDLTP